MLETIAEWSPLTKIFVGWVVLAVVAIGWMLWEASRGPAIDYRADGD